MKTRLLAFAALAALLTLTTACGSDGSGGESDAAAPAAANETATDTATGTPGDEASASATESATGSATGSATASATASASPSASASASASPFGAACSEVPASVAGEPVGKAISGIPSLSTLSGVMRTAGLARTLNKGKDFTLFAPTNEAFTKVPKKKLDRLMGNKQALSALVAYHVVKGRKTPADLRSGKLKTVQGGELTTTGSGQSFKINDANVVCGDVVTRNATVYMIDSVLMPK
ncbi:fasciclin domain-containing protein [Sphaerimonospora cavernae]|uniref:Fasciclin domain-containing protein n=1 Tax=Sphaerimonospora cavernae TaxID=1740611 RepID=A0ABV6U689_9ACTN